MADRGIKQQNSNTRAAMRDHVNTQMGHASDGAAYGGHGKSVGAHPQTGSPNPGESGGEPAQKSKAHVPAPSMNGGASSSGDCNEGD